MCFHPKQFVLFNHEKKLYRFFRYDILIAIFYGKIEEWRMKPIEDEHPYIFLDEVYLKRSWGGEVQNVSVLVAIGVNSEGMSF